MIACSALARLRWITLARSKRMTAMIPSPPQETSFRGNLQSSDPIGIDNNGTILTGAGRDTVHALHGGFQGSGRLHLGRGNDSMIGFVHAKGVKASFVGGAGRDAVLLNTGVYTINDGLITLAGTARSMRTSGFERIGGIHGGLFGLADGELTITNSVAVSLV
jgi:hypothetical protein